MSDSSVHAPVVERVLVGLDGSEESRIAGEWALMIARETGAELIAFHAVGLLDVWPDGDGPAPAESHAHVRQQLTDWAQPLRDRGADVREALADGPPTDTMLRYATSVDAHLIVVGSRGLGDTPIGALGSTSSHLVQSATVPVLVVPHAATRR